MDKKKIAEKIKQLRGDKSREQMCLDLGISYHTLTSYEWAVSIPSDVNKIKIAKYFNVSVGWLFFDEKEV